MYLSNPPSCPRRSAIRVNLPRIELETFPSSLPFLNGLIFLGNPLRQLSSVQSGHPLTGRLPKSGLQSNAHFNAASFFLQPFLPAPPDSTLSQSLVVFVLATFETFSLLRSILSIVTLYNCLSLFSPELPLPYSFCLE